MHPIHYQHDVNSLPACCALTAVASCPASIGSVPVAAVFRNAMHLYIDFCVHHVFWYSFASAARLLVCWVPVAPQDIKHIYLFID